VARAGTSAARRLLSDPADGVYVATEVLAADPAAAAAAAAGVTAVGLGAALAARGVPAPTALVAAPRVVFAAGAVSPGTSPPPGTPPPPVPPVPGDITCSLGLGWEGLIAAKLADRLASCTAGGGGAGEARRARGREM
jgi:hypothetical protein